MAAMAKTNLNIRVDSPSSLSTISNTSSFHGRRSFSRQGSNNSAARACTSSTICKFYLQGNCTRGTSCPFRHELDGSVPAVMTRTPTPRSKSAVCSFYLQGKCNRGSSCIFRHEVSGGEGARNSAQGMIIGRTYSSSSLSHQSQHHCRYFAKGYCSRGSSCQFLHDEKSGSAPVSRSSSGVGVTGYQSTLLPAAPSVPKEKPSIDAIRARAAAAKAKENGNTTLSLAAVATKQSTDIDNAGNNVRLGERLSLASMGTSSLSASAFHPLAPQSTILLTDSLVKGGISSLSISETQKSTSPLLTAVSAKTNTVPASAADYSQSTQHANGAEPTSKGYRCESSCLHPPIVSTQSSVANDCSTMSILPPHESFSLASKSQAVLKPVSSSSTLLPQCTYNKQSLDTTQSKTSSSTNVLEKSNKEGDAKIVASLKALEETNISETHMSAEVTSVQNAPLALSQRSDTVQPKVSSLAAALKRNSNDMNQTKKHSKFVRGDDITPASTALVEVVSPIAAASHSSERTSVSDIVEEMKEEQKVDPKSIVQHVEATTVMLSSHTAPKLSSLAAALGAKKNISLEKSVPTVKPTLFLEKAWDNEKISESSSNALPMTESRWVIVNTPPLASASGLKMSQIATDVSLAPEIETSALKHNNDQLSLDIKVLPQSKAKPSSLSAALAPAKINEARLHTSPLGSVTPPSTPKESSIMVVLNRNDDKVGKEAYSPTLQLTNAKETSKSSCQKSKDGEEHTSTEQTTSDNPYLAKMSSSAVGVEKRRVANGSSLVAALNLRKVTQPAMTKGSSLLAALGNQKSDRELKQATIGSSLVAQLARDSKPQLSTEQEPKREGSQSVSARKSATTRVSTTSEKGHSEDVSDTVQSTKSKGSSLLDGFFRTKSDNQAKPAAEPPSVSLGTKDTKDCKAATPSLQHKPNISSLTGAMERKIHKVDSHPPQSSLKKSTLLPASASARKNNEKGTQLPTQSTSKKSSLMSSSSNHTQMPAPAVSATNNTTEVGSNISAKSTPNTREDRDSGNDIKPKHSSPLAMPHQSQPKEDSPPASTKKGGSSLAALISAKSAKSDGLDAGNAPKDTAATANVDTKPTSSVNATKSTMFSYALALTKKQSNTPNEELSHQQSVALSTNDATAAPSNRKANFGTIKSLKSNFDKDSSSSNRRLSMPVPSSDYSNAKQSNSRWSSLVRMPYPQNTQHDANRSDQRRREEPAQHKCKHNNDNRNEEPQASDKTTKTMHPKVEVTSHKQHADTNLLEKGKVWSAELIPLKKHHHDSREKNEPMKRWADESESDSD